MIVWTLYIVMALANGRVAVYTAEFNRPQDCEAVAAQFAAAACYREVAI